MVETVHLKEKSLGERTKYLFRYGVAIGLAVFGAICEMVGKVRSDSVEDDELGVGVWG